MVRSQLSQAIQQQPDKGQLARIHIVSPSGVATTASSGFKRRSRQIYTPKHAYRCTGSMCVSILLLILLIARASTYLLADII